jgi:hypothetical protein
MRRYSASTDMDALAKRGGFNFALSARSTTGSTFLINDWEQKGINNGVYIKRASGSCRSSRLVTAVWLRGAHSLS